MSEPEVRLMWAAGEFDSIENRMPLHGIEAQLGLEPRRHDPWDERFNPYHDKHTGQFTSGGLGYPAMSKTSEGELLKQVRRTGGFTYHTIKGYSPTRGGYMVSPYPERGQVISASRFRRSDLEGFTKANADLLGKPDHFLGAWTSDGKVYLDVSVLEPSRDKALKLGKDHQQEAIWDLDHGAEVTVRAAPADAHRAGRGGFAGGLGRRLSADHGHGRRGAGGRGASRLGAVARAELEVRRYDPWDERRFNPYHRPGGSSQGGQFTSKGGGFGGGRLDGVPVARVQDMDELPTAMGCPDRDLQPKYHPERYTKDQWGRPVLKSGERENRVGQDSENRPITYDVMELPKGESVEAIISGKYKSAPDPMGVGLRPLVVVPGSERPLPHVYRMMSRDEWNGAHARGYFQSDQRLNLVEGEGTVTSMDWTGTFYAQPGENRFVRLKVTPEENWRVGSDGYVKTQRRIPVSRADLVSPAIEVDADRNITLRFNPHHAPAGSPKGGQFTSGKGPGGGSTATESSTANPDTWGSSETRQMVAKYDATAERAFPNQLSIMDVHKDPAARTANALLDYYRYEGTDLNAKLREGYTTPYSDGLDALMSKSRTHEALTVHRVMNDTVAIARQLKKGSVITDKGFMSTTLNPHSAAFFHTQGESAFSRAAPTHYIISLPKGHKAMYLDGLSGEHYRTNTPSEMLRGDDKYGNQSFRHVHEVLLPRGTKLRVDSVEMHPTIPAYVRFGVKGNVRVVYATVLP